MSDTTTTSTLRAVPAPAPARLTGLTDAAKRLHTELTRLTEPVTAIELALATGVGRSTAGKALTTLEQRGLALRIPGGHIGARRAPDHWHAVTTETTSEEAISAPANKPASTGPDGTSTNTTEPVGDDPARSQDSPAHDETQETLAAPDDGANSDSSVTEPPHDGDSENSAAGDNPDEGRRDAPGSEQTPALRATAKPSATTEAIILPGEKRRLAPGGLRQLVVEHLQAHPGEAFTATRISRVIEKSSGAIANALATLTRQGIATQVSDRPRTYRLATTGDNG